MKGNRWSIFQSVNIGENSMTLSWARPNFDGGGRIRGYLIEKREAGTDIWQKCNYNTNPSTSCVVNNLIENRDYEFRVFAVNDAGHSEPSVRYFFNCKDVNLLFVKNLTSNHEKSESVNEEKKNKPFSFSFLILELNFPVILSNMFICHLDKHQQSLLRLPTYMVNKDDR